MVIGETMSMKSYAKSVGHAMHESTEYSPSIKVREGEGLFGTRFYLKDKQTGKRIEDVGKREKYIRNIMNRRIR